ncbi:MAG: molybdopterin biosynthesis protein [Thaumarchaeota archaeon]|nr:molybdopterin biosynthesis protein [Nitrososphaerota archaeon]
MSGRKIFKTLTSAEEALSKLEDYCRIEPVGAEEVSLLEAYGRVLAQDVVSSVDVPGFDRVTMDGYAVKASDTFEAKEDSPIKLRLTGVSQPGDKSVSQVRSGEAVEVGTGADMPRGANAVVMVEYTQSNGDTLNVFKAVSPGENVMSAGSDIMTGELVLRRGQRVSPREVGVLAAVGHKSIKVYRKPRVAVISTGNELVQPGEKLGQAQIYDINSSSISASILENGGVPLEPRIVRDDPKTIKQTVTDALQQADLILTSGSTSAGAGDILYRIIGDMGSPGILVHGLSVKPGKPTIIAAVNSKPIIGLPGYPTSALMIFHLVVVPIVRRMAGLPETREAPLVEARTAGRIFSEKGRRELLPVHLISSRRGYVVYPVGLGSGAISSLALADGYIDIPKNQEFLDEGEKVNVRLLSSELRPADLIFMGSHCTGVDLLLQRLRDTSPNLTYKVVNNGSVGGFRAVERGEADIAGVHLLDEASGEYNVPFIAHFGLKGRALLVRGYNREQGLIVAKGNPKKIQDFKDLLRSDVIYINRNLGAGTRVLADIRLKKLAESEDISFDEVKRRIQGYDVEAKSHSAVAAAVAQRRADVGLGIRTVAYFYGLDFIPVADEMYDFLIPVSSSSKDVVKRFLEVLRSKEFQADLRQKMPGLEATAETGKIIANGKIEGKIHRAEKHKNYII